MSSPSAKVICDSVSPEGHRLTTVEVKMHRFVLAEFNTHRMFSRNSASSRAIPFHKQVTRLQNDPAIPVSFPAEQSGMTGGAELDLDDRKYAIESWLTARDLAIEAATTLHEMNVHKSVCSRVIEPFMWHTVIVTATDWDGFWRQRCSPLAQPEMRAAAECMKKAYDASSPVPVARKFWHLPYIKPEDVDWALEQSKPEYLLLLRKISTARCARVSYLTHDGVRDLEEDIKFYDRLVSADPPHASPLEHVATPAGMFDARRGNFVGWHQLRHLELNF